MIQKVNRSEQDPYDRPNLDWQIEKVSIDGQYDPSEQVQFKHSSLRLKRKKFTFAVTVFVMGITIILLQPKFRNTLISPGPLSSNHAQIIAAKNMDSCAACHDVGSQDPVSWFERIFHSGAKVRRCQSELCMDCHRNSMDEQFATKPHNLDPAKLQLISDRKSGSRFQWIDSPVTTSGDIECSTCHREHHGHADLKVLTDQQCQTCHAEQFHSFKHGHPEFSWRSKPPQNIAFDHSTHALKHFPTSQKNFDCKACHVDDSLQSVKLLASYEQTCYQCHQKDIDGSTQQGLALLRIPMLDLDAIRDQGLAIGDWPEDATGDFDGEVPEYMRLLLFKNDKAREILSRRGTNFEFADIDPDEPQDVADAVELSWAIKELLYDLAIDGPKELRHRLEYATQRSISEVQFHKISNGLEPIVFARAANRWMPSLAAEVPNYRGQSEPQSVAELFNRTKILRYFKDEDPGLLIENPLDRLFESSGENGFVNAESEPTIQPAVEFTEQSSQEDSLIAPYSEPEFGDNDVDLQDQIANESPGEVNWLTGEPEDPIVNNPTRALDSERALVETEAPNSQTRISTSEIPSPELLVENPLGQKSDSIRNSIATERAPKPGNQGTESVSSVNSRRKPVLNRPKRNTSKPVKMPVDSDPTSLPIIGESELLAKNPIGYRMQSDPSDPALSEEPLAPDLESFIQAPGEKLQKSPRGNSSQVALDRPSPPPAQNAIRKDVDESEWLAKNPMGSRLDTSQSSNLAPIDRQLEPNSRQQTHEKKNRVTRESRQLQEPVAKSAPTASGNSTAIKSISPSDVLADNPIGSKFGLKAVSDAPFV
ncbi:MAG: hypothetical protein AAGA30_14695, partial [Planctomycetota bacterium]